MSGDAVTILFRSRNVLYKDQLQEASILVGRDGKIVHVFAGSDVTSLPAHDEVVDAGDLVIMPGLVDSHVHVNEPGRTEWEGYRTATRAAAAGGVTTIVDMPLNSIPSTTTVANLQTKLESVKGQIHVDVAFWGGVVPGNQEELKPLVRAGVVGFKCFLCPSGIDEFPYVGREDVEAALSELRGTGSLLAFHAELELKDPVSVQGDDPRQYQTYLRTRPPKMEEEAIKQVAELCGNSGVRCHIVHLSAASALPLVAEAKTSGCPLTAETCFHYLALTAEEVPDGATQYKCCPPIRERSNQEHLWTALHSGLLDMVVSDHSPSTADLKHLDDGDFLQAWGGISSVQFGLSIFWTNARRRGFTIADTSRLLSERPALVCGLQDRKGRLAPGMDADFVIWDPEDSFQVEESIIEFKNKVTPYMGMTLTGKVHRTVVRGRTVFKAGSIVLPPQGQAMLNKTTN